MTDYQGSKVNKRMLVNTVATVFLIEGLAMVPSFLMAAYDRDRGDMIGIGLSILILLSFAAVSKLFSRNKGGKLRIRESYIVVLVAWIAAVTGGMLPYIFSDLGLSFSDAVFESAAAWTTTNAWIVDVNSLPKSIVLWKATSNWLGGMGIILLTIIIISAVSGNAQKLVGMEIAGPEFEKHTARMADTVKLIYVLYISASIVEFVLFVIGGVPIFDAVINTMSTISTSGTIDYDGGLAGHFTPFIKAVVIVFSIFASVNFAVYIRILKKKAKDAFKDFELQLFGIIIVSATVLIAVILLINGVYRSLWDALINAATGVVSFSCTTGFTLEHVEVWPSVCKIIFILLMLIGGCATSTAGGIKVIRFAVIVELIKRGVYKRIHPRAVKPVMVKDMVVSTGSASSISTYTLLFLGVYLVSVVIISLENLDMETTLSAPLALLTNCGVGFGKVANADYGMFSQIGRLYLAFLMILGRLELYALLILFSRSFWRPNK